MFFGCTNVVSLCCVLGYAFLRQISSLAIPLHLIGSDACEIVFSKIGGMVGLERAYDFHE
jgi:hypothetical protein